MFLVSGPDGPGMLEFREEAINPAGVADEGRRHGSARAGSHDGPRADICEAVAQPVSAIGGIRQQCPAGPDGDMLLLFSQTCINNPETALVVYDRDPSCLIPRFDGAI